MIASFCSSFSASFLHHPRLASRSKRTRTSCSPVKVDNLQVQGEMLASKDQLLGYIFMCNGKTKADCYRYGVFGLPPSRIEVVEKIKPGMKLFLFDFDLKLLYGIYTAVSPGNLQIEPMAFGGKFSAQVRFEIFKDCLPLPESAFKHIIKDKYSGGSKFKQDLTAEQVNSLISIFRPMNTPSMPETLPPSRTVFPSSEQIRHVGPFFSHVPHASSEKLAYFPDAYSPDNPALAGRGMNSRDAALSYDGERTLLRLAMTSASYKHNPYIATNNDMAQASTLVASSQYPETSRAHAPPRLEPLTAAYWVAVASETARQVNPSHHEMPLASADLSEKNVMISSAEAVNRRQGEYVSDFGIGNYYTDNLALGASNESHTRVSIQLHEAASQSQTEPPESEATPSQHVEASSLSQLASSHGPAVWPSSSLQAANWIAVASEDPKQVYSDPHHSLPLVNHHGVGNLPASLTGAAVGYGTLSDKWVYSYDHNQNTVPLQTHTHVPSQVSVTTNGVTYWPSSSETAAYWTVAPHHPNQVYANYNSYPYFNHHDQAASAVNGTLQSLAEPPQVPVSLQGAAITCAPPEADALWRLAASSDTNQVHYGAYQYGPR